MNITLRYPIVSSFFAFSCSGGSTSEGSIALCAIRLQSVVETAVTIEWWKHENTSVCAEYPDCVPYPYDIWWSLGLFMSCWSTIRIKVCKMSLFRLFESLHFDQISGIFTSPLSFLRDPLWLLTNRHNTPQTSQTNVGNTKQRKKPARLWFGFLPGNL